MDYEIPKRVLLFGEYALGMRFLLSYLPVDCILGTPFLSAVEPHGSAQTPGGNPSYFITMPKIKNHPPIKKILAFMSESHSHITYCSRNLKTMVVINTWDDLKKLMTI
jgi:hypothetical protein